MIKELSELLEEIYEIYGRLYYNYDLINDEEKAAYISDCIFEQFKAEYKLFKAEHDTEITTKIYHAEEKNAIIIPKQKRFLFFWKKRNRAAKIEDRELAAEIEEIFKRKEEALARTDGIPSPPEYSKIIYPEPEEDYEDPAEDPTPEQATTPAAEPTAEPATEQQATTPAAENPTPKLPDGQPEPKKKKKKNRPQEEPAKQPMAEAEDEAGKKNTVAGFEETPVPGGTQISIKL